MHLLTAALAIASILTAAVGVLAAIGRYTAAPAQRAIWLDWLRGGWAPDVLSGANAVRELLATMEHVHHRRQQRLRPWLTDHESRYRLWSD